jgi:hypothetical protein
MAVNFDAATITAIGTAVAAVIGALGVVVKIVVTRPKMPVAEEILTRQAELEAEQLKLAAWAHEVAIIAAAAGIELPEPPASLSVLGRRPGEGRHAAAAGWRASVKAQTGETPAVEAPAAAEPPTQRLEPVAQEGPSTWPERRRPRLPPPPTR